MKENPDLEEMLSRIEQQCRDASQRYLNIKFLHNINSHYGYRPKNDIAPLNHVDIVGRKSSSLLVDNLITQKIVKAKRKDVRTRRDSSGEIMLEYQLAVKTRNCAVGLLGSFNVFKHQRMQLFSDLKN